MRQCTLADFEDDEINLFIDRWTQAIEKQAQRNPQFARSDAAAERDKLRAAIPPKRRGAPAGVQPIAAHHHGADATTGH